MSWRKRIQPKLSDWEREMNTKALERLGIPEDWVLRTELVPPERLASAYVGDSLDG